VRDDISDEDAVLIYAAENLTQRGDSSTASIASWAQSRPVLSTSICRYAGREGCWGFVT